MSAAGGVALGAISPMTASLVGLGRWLRHRATMFAALETTGGTGYRAIRSEGSVSAIRLRTLHLSEQVKCFAPQLSLETSRESAAVHSRTRHWCRVCNLIVTFAGLATVNVLVYALADRLRTTIRKPSILGWMTRIGAVS
jgi:threonine/homoserine/homoserine lactone efflux protein